MGNGDTHEQRAAIECNAPLRMLAALLLLKG
jgi:hypothetical protein